MRKISGTSTLAPAAMPAPSPAPAWQTHPVLARALYATASGDPIVVVSSPPGAGKTFLITHMAAALVTELGLRVAIAAQTTAQGHDVAGRVVELGVATGYVMPSPGARKPLVRPTSLHKDVALLTAATGPEVTVATSAKWQWLAADARADVLLVDEAYQLTAADLAAMGTIARQVVLVGDPGQISPVITGSTRRWEHLTAGPHTPAPTALLARYPEQVAHFHLPHTYRLGPATTDLIAPLYPSLSFTSRRAHTCLTRNGRALPELAASVGHYPAGRADAALPARAAQVVNDLLTTTLTTTTTSRPLTARDVAVIAPHADQVAMIQAALADVPGVLVGTINQAQGLEREAVVVVHPLLGHRQAEDFALDLGRLCVALSRHRSHAHVLTDATTPTLLADASTSPAAQLGSRLLHTLLNP